MTLITELGEPYGALWKMLTERYGDKEASSILARILGAVLDHGECPVSDALATALSEGRVDLLALACHLEDREERTRSVAVPDTLSGYRIEAANPADYDRLLTGTGGGGP